MPSLSSFATSVPHPPSWSIIVPKYLNADTCGSFAVTIILLHIPSYSFIFSRKKKRWFRRHKITRNPRDKEIFDVIKRETRLACKQAYNSYLNDMFTDEGGQKRFWSFIKSKKTENSGIAPLADSRGITISTSEGKAEILNKQFTSVFGMKDSLAVPEIH